MSAQKSTVLLVEEDALAAKERRVVLESCGYSVEHVSSVTDAINTILDTEHEVDVILTEVDLVRETKEIDAAEFLRKQRAIPTVFLSSPDIREAMKRGEAVFGYGCVSKDADRDTLDTSIQIALGAYRKEKEAIRDKNYLEKMGALAKIGTWEYCPRDANLTLSKEVQKIFELSESSETNLDTILNFYTDESSGTILRAINLAIEEKKPFMRDSQIVAASGRPKWIRTQGEFLQDGDFDSGRVFGTIQDITEMRQIDRVSQESELTLNQVEQITHIGHWSVNTIDGSFFHSDEIKRIFGYEPSEYALSVEEAINAYHPGDREEVIRLFNRAVETGEGYEFDLRVIQPSGNIRNVHSKGYTRKREDGTVSSVYGVFQDITEAVQAVEALEKSRMLLQASLESQKDTILLSIDRDYRYLYFNRSHADIMKGIYDRDVKIGENILEYITSNEDREAARRNYDRALSGESHSNIRVYGEGSRKAWFESFFNPIINNENEIIGATAMARDISERKLAEEEMQESHNRYFALFEQAGDGIVMLNGKGKAFLVNETFADMHGYSNGEILQLGIENLDVEGSAETPERIRRILAGETLSFEVEHRHKEGHVLPLLVTANLILAGRERFIIAIYRDLSIHKKMEEELQKTQRLESLGILAGGLAHDFNNLMGGIYGYIDLAHGENDPNRIRKYLSKAIITIERSRALTQQLLTFAKGGAPIRKIGQLFPLVEESADFALSGSNVKCDIQVQEGLWACDFDKNQMGQVIDNLVINAQQAMPVGGTIELSARNIRLEDSEHPLLAEGDYVKIVIKDSGVGIPKDLLTKIFDPFFTTKSRGQGLGLATSYSIVRRHSGCIDVESEPGKGSAFTIYLPSSRDMTAPKSRKVTKIHKGKGLFLVMDDEQVLREVLAAMLEKFGYGVKCVADGMEAVQYYKSHLHEKENVAGMIFDLTVPGGLGGKEAAEQIRELNADVPIFVASGYAENPTMKNPAKSGFTASICKPFNSAELSETLEKYLNFTD